MNHVGDEAQIMLKQTLGLLKEWANLLLFLVIKVAKFFSFEWFLTLSGRPNGGGIITVRSFAIALIAFGIIFYGKYYWSCTNVVDSIFSAVKWSATVLGAVYVALYTRFASQWQYIANLYNKIKELETKDVNGGYGNSTLNKEEMDKWKAAFLEDAYELHLANKLIFISVVDKWSSNEDITKAFINNTPNGERRLKALRDRVEASLKIYNKEKVY